MEPPASILKPPGSIVEPPGLQPSFAYASHIQQHHLANVGQSLAWGSFLLCFCLPQQPCQSVGGGGVPPWGPSIRRPPKVCQQRARLISNWLCPITAGQSRHSFEQFVRAIRSEVFFPLSFPFPRSLGTTANPTPKSGKVWFFRIFGRFFRLPNRA